jgi:hypothetical protein
LPQAYVYLLGLYLGDGCISAGRRGVYRLRVYLDSKYPVIVSECVDAIRAVVPGNKVGMRLLKGSYYEVSMYSKSWPCLFPQHGIGKKHERPIALTVWQRAGVERAPGLLLRGLIHSDGCRFTDSTDASPFVRYAFTNRSADIRRIFCDACDLLGIRWTASGNDKIYVSRKTDVARLDTFVGPKG